VLFAAIVLTGLGPALLSCGTATPTPAAVTWALTVVNGEIEHSFSLVDLKALPAAEVRYTAKETGQENTYQGVRLRDLLVAIGADLANSEAVEVEARDGFMAVYPQEAALRDTSVLVYGMDDGPLPASMGSVRMLSPGEGNKFQVKFVSRLTVKGRE
jgi:DMSO/TMAO reductase YedYZ molybdopterin-dependent catalytic subunit